MCLSGWPASTRASMSSVPATATATTLAAISPPSSSVMRDAHRYCFTYFAAAGWAEALFTAERRSGAALLDQLGEELLAEEAPAEREGACEARRDPSEVGRDSPIFSLPRACGAERDRVAERGHAARDEAERGARGGEEHHQRRRGARDLRQHAELQHHRTQNDASAHAHQARHHPGDGGARQGVRLTH